MYIRPSTNLLIMIKYLPISGSVQPINIYTLSFIGFCQPKRKISRGSIQYVLPDVYRADASPYEIPLDVLIPEDREVLVQPGVVLRFADEAGFTVRGTLIVNGTKSAPVTFEPHNDRWKGIEIINAVAPSSFSHVNVTGSQLGITLRSGIPPSIDNVISVSNEYGFDFQVNAKYSN
ncbi:unnamed protein product [Nippostrongylus brasiliensis]|uniref:Galectin n=1 Tax=Nippostrongylus brasiliensis TaxID=27835 RepID=A0A0N4YVC3_NIPBR|nr:unnamed protein product [Nippostrongylus brasiliensis]